MLHKYIITGILFFLVLLDNQAQNKVTLNGTIRDKASGEEIIGATIRIAELSKIGISTNEYGFFSLTLEPGNYTFITSYIGYDDYIEKINIPIEEYFQMIFLKPSNYYLE